jgi:hypothetical protein
LFMKPFHFPQCRVCFWSLSIFHNVVFVSEAFSFSRMSCLFMKPFNFPECRVCFWSLFRWWNVNYTLLIEIMSRFFSKTCDSNRSAVWKLRQDSTRLCHPIIYTGKCWIFYIKALAMPTKRISFIGPWGHQYDNYVLRHEY